MALSKKKQYFRLPVAIHSDNSDKDWECRIWRYSTIMLDQSAYTSEPRKLAGRL